MELPCHSCSPNVFWLLKILGWTTRECIGSLKVLTMSKRSNPLMRLVSGLEQAKFANKSLGSSDLNVDNPQITRGDTSCFAVLVKLFFEELPDPLFTWHYCDKFISVASRFSLYTIVLLPLFYTLAQRSTMIFSAGTHYELLSELFLMRTMRLLGLFFW